MVTFLGIKHFKSGDAAILEDNIGRTFNIDEHSLKQLIETIKRRNGDVRGEMMALKALEEVNR